MTRKMRHLFTLLALLCIGFSFLLRHNYMPVSLTQICPAISDGDYQITLCWSQNSYSILGRNDIFRDTLKNAGLLRGTERTSMPNLCFEVRISHDGKQYILTIGADDTVSVAQIGDLEASRTFWKDPTGTLFDSLYPVSSDTGTGIIPGYRPDGNYETISFADFPYSEVHSIVIYNGHTGKTTYLTNEEEIKTICDFLRTVNGRIGQSSMGYYDTLHTLVLYRNESAAGAVLNTETPLLEITFGHNYFVYYGEYGDGYPIRYTLDGINCEDVFLFLQPYEKSLS